MILRDSVISLGLLMLNPDILLLNLDNQGKRRKYMSGQAEATNCKNIHKTGNRAENKTRGGGRDCARLEMMCTSERSGNCQTGVYQPFQSGSRAQSGARLARLPSGTQLM